MAEHPNIEQEIKQNIKLLARGLMLSDYSVAYEGYRNLYGLGQSVVEPLKSMILDVDWSKSKYKGLSRYVAGIFALIHDLDENEANEILKTEIAGEWPKHIRVLLKSICDFSREQFKRYEIHGIEILEHKEIIKRCDIQAHVHEWLSRVPPYDLLDISRLYLIGSDGSPKASGTYTPILFKIMVVWDNPHEENSFLFKLFSILTEQTLYHEIGHHVHRHSFGTDADQEREADRYAYGILRRNHPYLGALYRFLSKLGMRSERNYHRWGL